MKYNENMTMSERINFDRQVVNYINDNLELIKEQAEADNTTISQASVEHYVLSVKAANDEENYLSEEQKERFLNVAKKLFKQGFVEHAGVLDDISFVEAATEAAIDKGLAYDFDIIDNSVMENGREVYQIQPEEVAKEVLEDLKNYDGFPAHSFDFQGKTYYFVKQ